MQIQSSKTIKPSHLKVLIWGASGTRKTESILRHFPNVLMIDTEGNAEQCVTVPDIPEFLLARTKDVNEVIRVIDDVAAGRVKMPDGRAVETVAIDSTTVLWSVRKDARAIVAEEKVKRYGKTSEDASLTQLDWTMAKRPLVRMIGRLNNSPIKYLILTAREADEYIDNPQRKGEIVKVGVKPDMMKGLDYDVNLALHFMGGTKEGEAWSAEVTKVQGALGAVLPKGKRLTQFPASDILTYAGSIVVKANQDAGEDETAEAQAASEVASETAPRRAATRPQESRPATTSATTATVTPEPGQTPPAVTLTPEQIKAQAGAMLKEIGASGDDVRRVLDTTGVMEWLAAEGHTIDKLKSLVLDGMVSTATN